MNDWQFPPKGARFYAQVDAVGGQFETITESWGEDATTKDLQKFLRGAKKAGMRPIAAAQILAYLRKKLVCAGCGRSAPEDFYQGCPGGLCRTCLRRGNPPATSAKYCSRCSNITDDYNRDPRNNDGRQSICRACQNLKPKTKPKTKSKPKECTPVCVPGIDSSNSIIEAYLARLPENLRKQVQAYAEPCERCRSAVAEPKKIEINLCDSCWESFDEEWALRIMPKEATA
jgi:hypothetical protein